MAPPLLYKAATVAPGRSPSGLAIYTDADQYYGLHKGDRIYDVANIYGMTSTAIQLAVNDAQTAGEGAQLFLRPGIWDMTSTVQISGDGIALVGANKAMTEQSFGTILKVHSGFTNSTPVIKVQQTGTPARPVTGVTLRDFAIDGNAKTGTGIEGIYLQGYECVLHMIEAANLSGAGIHVQGLTSNAWNTYNTSLDQVYPHDNTGHGIWLDTYTSDVKIGTCVTWNNNDGLHAQTSGTHIHGPFHSYGNLGHGVNIDGAAGYNGAWLTSCYLENNQKAGLYIDNTVGSVWNVLCTNCKFWANGYATNNTWDNVQVAGGAQAVQMIITGSTFDAGTNANRTRYNLNLNNSAVMQTLITANKFEGTAGTGQVIFAGRVTAADYCVIKGNWGFNPVGSVTAPGIPATTVALVNTQPYDVTIYMHGGASTNVTAIAIGGVATGMVLGINGHVGGIRLGPGQSITLTYGAGAGPTSWNWYAD